MLQLHNHTPLKATISVFPDEDGLDTLYVLVKGTFSLEPRPSLSPSPLPPTGADEYWGEPGASSLKYASELHLSKPGTDVVVVGQAWAPRGRRVRELDAEVRVGKRSKKVRVFGDRKWNGGLLGMTASDPEPFRSMPLVYERAYGGVHQADPDSDTLLAEERNPVGVGFLGKRKRKEVVGEPLPNLEDPDNLLKKPGDAVAPVCFGFVAPSWQPRLSYAGTYDEQWQKTRAPYLPEDFDSRFFCAATPDLVFDPYLTGGEPVKLTNLSERGTLSFTLPRIDPLAEVTTRRDKHSPDLNLETVLIEPDEDRLCMTWRGAVPCHDGPLAVLEVNLRLEDDSELLSE